MTRDEALAILDLKREEAIARILVLAEKAEKDARLVDPVSPPPPSGMTPVYLKSPHKKRKKPPGRRKGHSGTARQRPTRIEPYQEHTLDHCPNCQPPLAKSVDTCQRSIEDLPPVQLTVTEHTLHRDGCPQCKKSVFPPMTEALVSFKSGVMSWFDKRPSLLPRLELPHANQGKTNGKPI